MLEIGAITILALPWLTVWFLTRTTAKIRQRLLMFHLFFVTGVILMFALLISWTFRQADSLGIPRRELFTGSLSFLLNPFFNNLWIPLAYCLVVLAVGLWLRQRVGSKTLTSLP